MKEILTAAMVASATDAVSTDADSTEAESTDAVAADTFDRRTGVGKIGRPRATGAERAVRVRRVENFILDTRSWPLRK